MAKTMPIRGYAGLTNIACCSLFATWPALILVLQKWNVLIPVTCVRVGMADKAKLGG
jgi:hypothetical protein